MSCVSTAEVSKGMKIGFEDTWGAYIIPCAKISLAPKLNFFAPHLFSPPPKPTPLHASGGATTWGFRIPTKPKDLNGTKICNSCHVK